MYCSTESVYRHAGISSSEVSEADITAYILEQQVEVDRWTNTTWWSIEVSGDVVSATNTTFTASASSFTADALIGMYVWIWTGTGSGQIQKITDNTTDTITIDADWDTNPDNTSDYRIIASGHDPRETETFDGDGTSSWFAERYPFHTINSISIKSTSVTVANAYVYNNYGEIRLGGDSEVSYWDSTTPQSCIVDYWYGIYETPIPKNIQELCAIYAAIQALTQQMGGTHNIPSTVTLPEGSYSIGQAYINIEGTIRRLGDLQKKIESRVQRYAAVG